MEEYWNLFLEWLGQINKTKRIAPKVSDRYKNSKKFRGRYALYDTEGAVQDKEKSLVGSSLPAEIFRYVRKPGDTVYVERPDMQVNPFGIGVRYDRTASTLDPRGNDYDILSRRWAEAMQYAR